VKGSGGGEQFDVGGGDKLFLGAAGVQRSGVRVGIFYEDADVSAAKGVAIDDGVDFSREFGAAHTC